MWWETKTQGFQKYGRRWGRSAGKINYEASDTKMIQICYVLVAEP